MAATVIALNALALRCNTYLGTDVTSSGTGIETCVVPINRCIQREYWFFCVTHIVSEASATAARRARRLAARHEIRATPLLEA